MKTKSGTFRKSKSSGCHSTNLVRWPHISNTHHFVTYNKLEISQSNKEFQPVYQQTTPIILFHNTIAGHFIDHNIISAPTITSIAYSDHTTTTPINYAMVHLIYIAIYSSAPATISLANSVNKTNLTLCNASSSTRYNYYYNIHQSAPAPLIAHSDGTSPFFNITTTSSRSLYHNNSHLSSATAFSMANSDHTTPQTYYSASAHLINSIYLTAHASTFAHSEDTTQTILLTTTTCNNSSNNTLSAPALFTANSDDTTQQQPNSGLNAINYPNHIFSFAFAAYFISTVQSPQTSPNHVDSVHNSNLSGDYSQRLFNIIPTINSLYRV